MGDVLTTKKERDIMRHALGNGRDKNRNYFVTGPGSFDYEACQSLVEKGLMVVRKHPFCSDFLYQVTGEGRKECQ